MTAHRDHLFLYAKGQIIGTPDPRNFASVAGTATTVEALGGKWAPSLTYGTSMVALLLNPMISTPAPAPAPSPHPLTLEERILQIETRLADILQRIDRLERP